MLQLAALRGGPGRRDEFVSCSPHTTHLPGKIPKLIPPLPPTTSSTHIELGAQAGRHQSIM